MKEYCYEIIITLQTTESWGPPGNLWTTHWEPQPKPLLDTRVKVQATHTHTHTHTHTQNYQWISDQCISLEYNSALCNDNSFLTITLHLPSWLPTHLNLMKLGSVYIVLPCRWVDFPPLERGFAKIGWLGRKGRAGGNTSQRDYACQPLQKQELLKWLRQFWSKTNLCLLVSSPSSPNTEAWPLLGFNLTCQIGMGREARQLS